ncbi:DUF2087 domain-containing protein [Chitinimonas sp. BJB300]|uniref:DUF2087 domain-containing protein n=1 Tax=Chitinimonas sp. BJB300 TaxID=1559339 RepID=UPI000C0CC43A|nr:DUF2087 domain-containing protein [Chitinimonas sp. BJB300]PHV10890.1 hypothetical protein CSQ89_13715 [Chitinimonas sp. BJB300]TSJ88177.1 DUF2087 domain-containing protein [Chitinimonas sp. BJB300]
MSRSAFPFHVPDISLLAKSLSKQINQQLAETSQPPSHLQLLNMLARAVGFQNYQHLRSQTEASEVNPVPVLPEVAPDASALRAEAQVAKPIVDSKRLLRHFDAQGRLMRWPGKFSEQQPCLWPIWARIPAARTMSETEVNAFIRECETFGDHVLLRRELVNYKLLRRTSDGAEYHRVEQAPTVELADFIRQISARKSQ